MRNVVLGAVLLVTGIAPGRAAPVPAVDVPVMTAAAELIVVGRAQDIDVASGGAGSERFTVAIDRVVKGAPARQVQVRLDFSSGPAQSVGDRQYGIFFLQAVEPGRLFTVVDPAHPVLPAAPATGAAVSASTDDLASVTALLAEVLRTPAHALTSEAAGIANPTVGPPALRAQEAYREAAAGLQSIGFDKANATLLDIAEQGEPAGRLWAIDALLAMSDPELSAERKANLLAGVQAILIDPGPDLAYTVDMLSTSIEAGIDAAAAVPTMKALLASRRVAVRRAAAYVLGVIGGKEATVALAQHALQDDDQEVRYYAVLGLAEATGGEAPAMDLFKEREGGYVAHWRRWARSNIR